MEQKIRCQSCGMLLGEGFFGTQSNGSKSTEYCKFCFQNGIFTNPDQTLEEMIDSSVENMTKEQGFEEDKARELAESFIPNLKRWRNSVEL